MSHLAQPLVSCQCPTRNRPEFLRRALRYFARQTWKNAELHIFDDSDPEWQPLVESVVYEEVGKLGIEDRVLLTLERPYKDRGLALSDKRNAICQASSGDFLCVWDDDDWHAPWRIETLMERQLETGADFVHSWCYMHQMGTNWDTLRFDGDGIAFGTSLYRRQLAIKQPLATGYVCGEDLEWVERIIRCGAKLECVCDPSLYVITAHGKRQGVTHVGGGEENTCGRSTRVHMRGWRRWRKRGLDRLLSEDAPFYGFEEKAR